MTDAPIPNASVTATVGGQTFQVQADANGNYVLPVEIDEEDADQFVTLRAQGTADQQFVVFTSIAGSFQSLAEQAGDDKVLASTENFATQITNVSTAAAVLMQEANGGAPITSDALLRSVSATVDGQAVLDLAAAIKLSVDSAADYPLPEGQSILDVVEDAAARQQFIAANRAQDPNPALGGFRWRFEPGGYGSEENDFIDLSTGDVVTQDWHQVPSYGMYWRMDGEDIVVIKTPGGCLPGTDGCEVFEPRRIMPLGKGGVGGRTRIYSLDKLMVSLGGAGSPPTTFYVPHFFDYEPLTGSP